MKKIVPVLLILLLFSLTSLKEKESIPFEGTVEYQVLEPHCPGTELVSPAKVIYSTKDGLHRIEEVGGTRPMIYLYSDDSPYRTVCFEWMGKKIAVQEESKTQLNIAHMGSQKNIKHLGRKLLEGYDNFEFDVWVDESIHAKMPWMNMSREGNEIFPLKFYPQNQVECDYQLEFTKVSATQLKMDLFSVPAEYEFIEKTHLQDMFGEMESTTISAE